MSVQIQDEQTAQTGFPDLASAMAKAVQSLNQYLTIAQATASQTLAPMLLAKPNKSSAKSCSVNIAPNSLAASR